MSVEFLSLHRHLTEFTCVHANAEKNAFFFLDTLVRPLFGANPCLLCFAQKQAHLNRIIAKFQTTSGNKITYK